ncbi:PadR family transcriptional regulator [Herbiconiux sp. P15]|uniref:PadR family transcriptional regulator n=1 Tax=Herbiconiux liukaitaii TaxID=3342799 RepID=UPI0035BB2BAB
MSVRAGILAVLTASEAYGLQLHTELEIRTDRVGVINVGQIYSTLERLCAAGLVEAVGTTDDGLPLYGLTPAGTAEADSWLRDPALTGVSAWSDMVFKVLLATSLEGDGAAPLLAGYRESWGASTAASPEVDSVDAGDESGPAAALARRLQAEAAIRWIDEVGALPGGLEGLRRPLRNERPRRGRRPVSTSEQRDR